MVMWRGAVAGAALLAFPWTARSAPSRAPDAALALDGACASDGAHVHLLQTRSGRLEAPKAAPPGPAGPTVLAAEDPEDAPYAENPEVVHADVPHQKNKILVYWAVGSEERVMSLVGQNIDCIRTHWGKTADVYLAHYDSKRSAWQERFGAQWYEDNVAFSAEEAGHKWQIARRVLVGGDVDLLNYDWVWSLDEDVKVICDSLPGLLPLARETGSLLIGAAYTEPSNPIRSVRFQMSLPDKNCRYRYTNVVENMMTLMTSKAALEILANCTNCMTDTSVWGLDSMWCSWTARRLNHARDTACAILDATPMEHMDFMTMDKWVKDDDGKFIDVNRDWFDQANKEKYSQVLLHPFDTVLDHNVRTLKCVAYES